MANSRAIESSPPNCKHFTPDSVARLLMRPFSDRTPKAVLDPAFGDGALLYAAQRSYSHLKRMPKLVACDIDPPKRTSFRVALDRFWKQDFLRLNDKNTADLILMNPPFVRHHSIQPGDKRMYNDVCFPLLPVSSKADLWAYFLIKALFHLEVGGAIGAVLPWSFLQSEFAVGVRELLAKSFARISVLALQEQVFEKAKERICLIWLEGFGSESELIQAGAAKHVGDQQVFEKLSTERWLSPRVIMRCGENVSDLLNDFSEKYGATELEQCARISIGVVTGADQFFIVDPQLAISLGLKPSELLPILRSLRGYRGFRIRSNHDQKVVLRINGSSQLPSVIKYLELGEKCNIHQRSHSLRREPWYRLRLPDPPNAFFPYRSSAFPYSILNPDGLLATNSSHSLYFKDLSQANIRWLQVSLVSAFAQLSIEARSKVYGDGMMKVEPGALKRTPIFLAHDRVPAKVFNAIDKHLQNGDKYIACLLATELIQSAMNVPQDVVDETLDGLTALQDMRLTK